MAYLKVITPPTSEPLSITEVKKHLRIFDNGYDDTITSSITPITSSPATVTGMAVDVLGNRATVFVQTGTIQATAKLDVAIHHSDDNITYAKYYDFAQLTSANSNSSVSYEYDGGKRYIKAIAAVTVANATFGVEVDILSGDPLDDAEISNFITRARVYGEELTGRYFATQTVEQGLDHFPDCDCINLRPPVQSVTSVKVLNTAGTERTLASTTDYLLDDSSVPARLVLPYNGSWPTDADYPINPIRIRYVAGYATLPQNLKEIMLYHIGLMDKYRDAAPPDEDIKALHRMYNFWRVRW